MRAPFWIELLLTGLKITVYYLPLAAASLSWLGVTQLFQVGSKFGERESWSTQQVQ